MKKIVILISGRGSNMQAIVQASQKEQWPAQIVAVISNKADAAGLQFAQSQGIPTQVVESKGLTREVFDQNLQQVIDQCQADLVVLAGFMRILTPAFVQHYQNRIINIHPSLLPSFVGLHTHQQALDAGVKLHGATVHFVTAELDHGPIIDQACIRVLSDDTEQSLAQRLLEKEHLIYPRAVRLFIEDKLEVQGDRVLIKADTSQF
ncbi:phosphoribosylglycinamide formyltransferase [Undibacterium sp. LX40W]|uniref:Phosphoribosylglycinamide formyltransferase n=1 Tax=Undibacterium nitidum TaxID=2762298 RepID=A0A923KVE1_9BURK|nr:MULTISPECIES: phosphoribosylglycinamide formyltransferase [Undibacterium]MBC3883067.1 phosphoribosylglycinamide formyltransferase [Undibacterium nitidum]MBC3893348.1 phosphoribosylglycinamide formyltransferase [Undibacterium sp. LX40W]